MTPILVVLGEPRRLLRDALVDGLATQPDIEVAAWADSAASTLLQAERTRAQVILLSAAMRGCLPEVSEGLRQFSPRPRTLFLDHGPDEEHLLEAVEAGVDGYTTGIDGFEDVAEAIRVTARGESVVPPAMLGPLLRRLIQRRRDASEAADRLSALTRREREVFGLLIEGQDDGAMAATLFISPETARTHVQRILRKLGVHSRAEAVALATRSGMADHLERAIERSAS